MGAVTAGRLLLVAVVWTTAVAASLFVAATTKIGPVVLSITPGRHGVHAGDLVAVGVTAVWASIVTIALLLVGHGDRRDG